jgi:hypothetical protein
MKQPAKPLPSLMDIEREVVAESREWGRLRLEERLQKLAAEHGEVFPPKATPPPGPDAPQRTRRNSARR